MSRIFSTTDFDTPEIIALRASINNDGHAIDQRVKAHRQLERTRFEEYTALLLERRPAYPTSEILQGLTQVAQLMHAGHSYGDHHGHPRAQDVDEGITLPTSVCFCSGAGRVNVFANAPYAPESANRLWKFTDDERTLLREHLQSIPLRILDEWEHDDGVGFIVAPIQT